MAASMFFSVAYAKDSMFGERDEWHVAQENIDDIFKYDLAEASEDGQVGYDSIVNDITALGIMSLDENGLFNEGEIVTKKELAIVINKIRYRGESYIEDTQNKYGSDEKVTLKNALASMVEVLGYGIDTQSYTSNGELYVAIRLGLLRDVDYSNVNRYLTRGDLATIVYNSFDVNIQKEENLNGMKTYSIKKNSSVLSEYMDIVKVEGVLNGINGLNLYAYRNVREGTVEIDGAVYNTDDDCTLLFGKRVVVYAKKNDDNKLDIVYLREKTGSKASVTYEFDAKNNAEITVDSIKIDTADGEKVTIDFSDLKYCMYNGSIVSKNEIGNKIKNAGYGTIVLSASDMTYDTIIVKSYDTYFVQYINPEDQIITPYYDVNFGTVASPNYLLEIPEDAVINVVDTDGKKLTLSSIKQKSVIDIYQSADGKYAEIVVSTKKYTGSIKTIENNEYVTFDSGETYVIDKLFATLTNAPKLDYDSTGTFYISSKGRICGYESGDAAEWGYVRLIGKTDDLDTNYILRLFDSSGTWQQYFIADKITLDGIKSVAVTNAVENTLRAFIDDTDISNNIIRFKLNNDGEVNFIDTIIDNPAESEDDERVIHHSSWDDQYTSNWTEGFSWKTSGGGQVPYHITNDSVIFSIPEDRTKEKKYSVNLKTVFVQDEKYRLKFYSADEWLICGAAIIDEGGGTSASGSVSNESYLGSTLFGVESVKKVLDSEGDVAYAVVGWEWKAKPTKKTVYLPEDFLDNNDLPVVGGVYRIIYSGDGTTYTKMDLLMKDGIIPDIDPVNAGNTHERMTGTIVAFSSGMIKIKLPNGDESSWQTNINGSYMIYDRETKKFTAATYQDLYVGEKIYIYGAVENAGGMLVCRN